MKKSLVLIVCLVSLALCARAAVRTIGSVEPVRVTTPVGTAPRLPFQVWVTYADGSHEWRQVRWTNASLSTEMRQADAAQTPVGTTYTVKGFVTGDNTTPGGYPLLAEVTVTDVPWAVPDARPVAEPLPLDKVMLTGDNRLTHNRDLDIDHLLNLDIRQQLYNYRDTYGLPTEGYPESDGWDSPTTKLKGHGSGHYMSALAMAYAGCADREKKARLKALVRQMVDELRLCQERTFVFDDSLGRYREARDLAPEDELRTLKGTWEAFDEYKKDYAHYGYGYLNAIPAQHCALIEMYRPYNNEQWVWAPYYSVHKQLAGLIDIATYVDDRAIRRKALLIAKDMGLWVWNRLHYRTYVKTDGTQEERRLTPGNRYEMWNMYIAGEVGGMAESLACLAAMVSDADEKAHLLEAANCFDSPAFFDPLARNVDAIRTRHANQHIPMITGALRSYRVNANPYYYNVAQNFWAMVQGRYRYAMGGVGNGEMFRQPYTQMLAMNTNVGGWGRDRYPEPTINETCCAYNLAKLTKDLNCFRPDDARYMDYYERLLYNQLVGSIDPHEYHVLYQYAVGLDASKPWGNETPQSTCCGGTGAENHVKYQEAAYFVGADTLWVALYLPTTARWDARGVTLEQTCEWPAQSSVIRVTKGFRGLFRRATRPFTMRLRVPYWATEGFAVVLNGQPVASSYTPGTYVEISQRRWRKTDVVEVTMPYTRHIDFGPDKMELAATGKNETSTFTPEWLGAFMYGPLVMAAKDLHTWDEASLDVEGFCGELAQGTSSSPNPDSSIPHSSFLIPNSTISFIPDYEADRHVTHYLRMNLIGASSDTSTLPAELLTLDADDEDVLDETPLREAMQVARTRRDAQTAWNELKVKVPDYAPWAQHGFRRMMEQYDRSQRVFDNLFRTQDDINRQAAALNAALNTMRPGNLPELEDMDGLLPLLERAKAVQQPSAALKEAVEYADMVVKYVSDGSGTLDMIQRATEQLNKDLK
ncbi:MAG: glycoside hydrolase family 127 protein [Bacteroidaceae bacterium]|nr:glycoside hydrolase family 127 protein [Bacteroidaceae bacterium]